MGSSSDSKAAAMRATFFADLDVRLIRLAEIADRLRSAALTAADARSAVLAQLHDIKGSGAPYGVPEATAIARSYEQKLKAAPLESKQFNQHLAELIGDLSRIAK